jgi:C4-dicarboxylate-specific signal transduction histidine kinase
MNQTIKDFSNFFEPTKEKTFFTINNLIEEALHIVHNSFQESNLKVILNIKQQYTIFGYKGELLQVILNILNNTKDAILFNKQNKGVITIKVEEKSEMIVITFEDDAGGIKDEIINRIFEPYFTTKFKNQGTGIGLYMCKVIIEESMKGSLEIKNYQNGVQCTIMIPKD